MSLCIERSLVVLAAAAILAACDPAPDAASPDAGPPVPEPRCRPGSTWAPGGAPAFVERTDAWGLAGLQGHALTTGDIDGDGFADLITMNGITNARGTTRVLLNRPDPSGAGRTFVDATESSGFLATRDGEGGRLVNLAVLGDLDGDGDADAITGTFRDHTQDDVHRGDVAEVVLNDGTGHFELGPPLPGFGADDRMATSIALTDQDLDGRLDAFFAAWWQQPPFSSPFGQHPELHRGDGRGGFTDVTEEVGIVLDYSGASVEAGTHARPLFGAAACDVSGDGRPDLLGAAYGQMWNLLWVSDPEGGAYREIGRASGFAGDDVGDGSWMQNGNTFSVVCGDVDSDGDLDVYTGEIRHADARGAYTDPSSLLLNEGGGLDLRFARPDRDAIGLGPPPGPTREEGGQNNGMLDFDLDGRLDVYLGGSAYSGQMQASWLFQQLPAGDFRWIGAEAGFDHRCPHGMAVADFDHDGDEDVVVGTYGCADEYPSEQPEPFRFYENVASENDWISIRAVGAGEGAASASGIGAWVRVTAGGVTQLREIHGSWGRISLSREPVAHFGLGSACEIERVEVRWPDAEGSVEVFEGVVANHRVEIRQGEGRVRYLELEGR